MGIEMNTPNKLTMLRVLMIPVFLVFLLVPIFDPFTSRMISAAIFVLAAVTDALDGYLARKHNLVTTFGVFMDPLADKLLVCAALVALVGLSDLPSWVVIVIISREFIISGFRLVASNKGIVIAAGSLGKIKTVLQMVMTVFYILPFRGGVFDVVGWVCIIAASAFTVGSLIEYIYKNFDVLKEGKK